MSDGVVVLTFTEARERLFPLIAGMLALPRDDADDLSLIAKAATETLVRALARPS